MKPHKPNDIETLLDIMARLRAPGTGCPWDLEQTFQTIAPYTIEEAYEVADAIARDDMIDLKDELGDLLLQVVFHAQMANEAGAFAFGDVVEAIATKMVRRHPHVFGDTDATSPADVKVNWEAIKDEEKALRVEARRAAGYPNETNQPESCLDGVPDALPALMRAEKLQKKAARVGFDWRNANEVIAKIEEEISEVRDAIHAGNREAIADEIGDLLFAVTNLARHLGLDPEEALRQGNRKFERRFKTMERSLEAAQQSLAEASLDDMEAAWQAAKTDESR